MFCVLNRLVLFLRRFFVTYYHEVPDWAYTNYILTVYLTALFSPFLAIVFVNFRCTYVSTNNGTLHTVAKRIQWNLLQLLFPTSFWSSLLC